MRVWVTRDEPPDGPLCTVLRDAGLTPVHEPVLTRRVVDDAAEVIAQLTADDWLVLTSVYAIEAVAVEPARVPRVAVVGDASRAAAEAKGLRVGLVSAGKGAKSLFAELRNKTTSGKVCYPRSSLAEPPKAWAQVEIVSPVLYETCPRAFDHSVVDRVDVVAVASPSAVDAIIGADQRTGGEGAAGSGTFSDIVPRDPPFIPPCQGGKEGGRTIQETRVRTSPLGAAERQKQHTSGTHPDAAGGLRRLRFASIGPTTSAALRRHGLEPWVEAPGRSFQSLAQAILRSRGGSRLAAYTMLALATLVGCVSLAAFFVFFLFLGPLDLVQLELGETTKSAWNTLLCVGFFLQHSVMVRRSYCQWSARFIPPHLHGASYTIASGVALLALVVLWQESAYTLMSARGTAWWLLRSVYFLAIVGFGWGILALGSFDTFGLRPILDRLRGTDTLPMPFTVRGPYRWVRHPLYLFSLLMIWSYPNLTTDRLLFNMLWTAWIVAATILEERDLVAVFGETYRNYQRKVPMLVPYRLRPVQPNRASQVSLRRPP